MKNEGVCACDKKNWVVVVRCGNYSAFSGYHFTPSDYSEIKCLRCGNFWRTKAIYVGGLRNATHAEALRIVRR